MLVASIFAQAVLHKEFVGAQSDKLLVVAARVLRAAAGAHDIPAIEMPFAREVQFVSSGQIIIFGVGSIRRES